MLDYKPSWFQKSNYRGRISQNGPSDNGITEGNVT